LKQTSDSITRKERCFSSQLWPSHEPPNVNGRAVETIVDSGALMSVVAATLVDSNRINRTQSVPVQVASGKTIFTLGTTDLELNFGGTPINHTALVLPTIAFQAVLGLVFLTKPPCTGIITTTEPCKLLYSNQANPLRKIDSSKDSYRLYTVIPFKSEA